MKQFDFVTEINALIADIDAAQKKLDELKAHKLKLHSEEFNSERPHSKPVFDYVDKILSPLFDKHNITLISQWNKRFKLQENGYYVMIQPTNSACTKYVYTMGGMTGANKEYCEYSSLERFKKVIHALADAMNRGESEYKFPADN